MSDQLETNVLIIDDDEPMCKLLARCVHQICCNTQYVLTLHDGLRIASAKPFDIILLDVHLPDGNGLEFLPRFKALSSNPEVIIVTGMGEPNGAELAIKNDAWGYIPKKSPAPIKEIQLQILRALEYRKEKQKQLKAPVLFKRGALIGHSPRLMDCLNQLAMAASSDVSVLLTGETGTGKELCATAIHHNSRRMNKNFVIVDCASLPENLVESTLFGHEKGAFTGADKSRLGLIKQADGGTLFLDEIGELPLELQKKFLRTLQEHRLRPVGSLNEETSNFRLIAATNRNLDDMVKNKLFREDLYYRIKSFSIELPPLRERKEDIKEIAIHRITQLCDQHQCETKGFSPDFFEALLAYDCPGNIRELINTLDGVFARTQYENTLFAKHLPTHIRTCLTLSSLEQTDKPVYSNVSSNRGFRFPTLKDLRENSLESIEKRYLNDLMNYTGGNIDEACHIAGVGRSRFYQLLSKYEIR